MKIAVDPRRSSCASPLTPSVPSWTCISCWRTGRRCRNLRWPCLKHSEIFLRPLVSLFAYSRRMISTIFHGQPRPNRKCQLLFLDSPLDWNPFILDLGRKKCPLDRSLDGRVPRPSLGLSPRARVRGHASPPSAARPNWARLVGSCVDAGCRRRRLFMRLLVRTFCLGCSYRLSSFEGILMPSDPVWVVYLSTYVQ